jgi:shikimate kinase
VKVVSGKAEAIAHGAATIVNAMASGEGAAFGVDLWTKAKVELTSDPHVVRVEIASDPAESTLLVERTVARVLRRFGVEDQFGAFVRTDSNIPAARGLKSSSVAANAVALATVTALGKALDDLEVINLGIDAAFDAKVTVTGAFDDACASFFGGIVITDNVKRQLVKQFMLPQGYSVLFLVPAKKAYSGKVDIDRIRTLAPMAKVAYKEAAAGNYWTALSLNGLIYSSAFGFDPSAALDALAAGALAAGLCGKGPAVTAIAPENRLDDIKTVWQSHEGQIIPAQLNCTKAKVVT